MVFRAGHLIALLMVVVLVEQSRAAEKSSRTDSPLHQKIDRMIRAANVGENEGVCNDSEFLRRLYLDLTGTIPSVSVAKIFLDDQTSDKRAKLIDRLLASPEFARHMARRFDVTLMERRGDKLIKTAQWREYLFQSFLSNKPYDQLAREILGADGVDPKLRPAARFYLDRNGETNLLTRDVGRKFFGKDFQCAQCHDHPLIDDYLQADYYGLYAFLNRSHLFVDAKKKTFFAEKGEGGVTFTSVFEPEEGKKTTRPRLPGQKQIDEPKFKKGEEYKVKPAKNVRPIPKYSRREKLALLATSGKNRAFNENIANRLWAQLLGRGIVHPVDLNHSANPATHPKLLRLLADDLVAHKFDIRYLLREISLSATYQKAIDSPADMEQQATRATATLAELEAKQKPLETALEKASAAAIKLSDQSDAAQAEIAGLEKNHVTLAAALAKSLANLDKQTAARDKTKKDQAARRKLATSLNELAKKASQAALQLPQDKEFVAAAGVLVNRAAKVNAELTSLGNQLTNQETLLKKAGQDLATAKASATGSNQKLVALRKKHAQPYETAMEQVRVARLALEVHKQRIVGANVFARYAKALRAADESATVIAKVRSQEAATLASLAQVGAAMQQAEKDRSAANAARDAAVAKAAQSQQAAKTKQDARDSLHAALAASKAALVKLPGDAVVLEAVAKLESRSDQVSLECTTMQKTAQTDVGMSLKVAQVAVQMQKKRDDMAGDMARLQTEQQALAKTMAKVQAESEPKKSAVLDSRDVLDQRMGRRFTVGSLKSLSPEQLAWSTMQAVGMIDVQRTAEIAAWTKKSKQPYKNTLDQQREIEKAVHAKIRPREGAFVATFGAGGGQPQNEFFATVDQALFFANDGTIRTMIGHSGNNLSARLNKMTDTKVLAEELYLAILTRRPAADEVEQVAAYLAGRKTDRSAAIQEIIWGLISSTEFRFNH